MILYRRKVCCRYDGCVVNVRLSSQVGLFNVHFCIHRRVVHSKAAMPKGKKEIQQPNPLHKISGSMRSELYSVYFDVFSCHCCDILRAHKKLFFALRYRFLRFVVVAALFNAFSYRFPVIPDYAYLTFVKHLQAVDSPHSIFIVIE